MARAKKSSPKRAPRRPAARPSTSKAKSAPAHPIPGSVDYTFDPKHLGSLASPLEFGAVDRRVLIPFQVDTNAGWRRIIDATAIALSRGPLHGSGLLLAGELPDEFTKLAPPPFVCARPAALFVSGSPTFVGAFVFRFAKALGANQVVEDISTLPRLDLLAAVSRTHVVLGDEEDLRRYAERIAKGGLNVTLCDPITIDIAVTRTAQAWIDALADRPSTKATAEHRADGANSGPDAPQRRPR